MKDIFYGFMRSYESLQLSDESGTKDFTHKFIKLYMILKQISTFISINIVKSSDRKVIIVRNLIHMFVIHLLYNEFEVNSLIRLSRVAIKFIKDLLQEIKEYSG